MAFLQELEILLAQGTEVNASGWSGGCNGTV
jgi:hypothetical protein